MEATKVLLILGAGSNVAGHTAKLFASKGYKIAVQSRGHTRFDSSYLHIRADLAKADSVRETFARVKEAYGSEPNVVIHNGRQYLMHVSFHIFPTLPDNPLTLSTAQLEHDLAVNTTSAYVAASEAVKGFETLPKEWPKSFIYTGNGLNVIPQPRFVSLGLAKTAMAHVLECCTLAFQGKGYTFYYGDERLPDGDYVAGAISGSAHALRYWELSQDKQQHPWMDTFVAGVGYTKFEPPTTPRII